MGASTALLSESSSALQRPLPHTLSSHVDLSHLPWQINACTALSATLSSAHRSPRALFHGVRLEGVQATTVRGRGLLCIKHLMADIARHHRMTFSL